MSDDQKPSSVENEWKWVIVHSSVLGCDIVVLRDKEQYKAAKAENPTMTIYFPQELELIAGLDDEAVKALHLIKSRFGGFIVPGLLKKDLRPR